MKKFLVIIFLGGMLISAGNQISAQFFSKVGTTGARFLKIYAEPRGTAMAGACIAMADDKSSLYWNPAGLAFTEGAGLIFADMNWVDDIRNDFIGFAIPRGLLGTFGMSITTLSMGKMEQTTVEQPEGTGIKFAAGSIAFALSYARKMTDKFAFGTTAKYIQERIWDISSHGVAFDFGSWLIISNRVRSAFVITNFGTDMRFTGGHLIVDEEQEGWPSGYVAPYPMEYSSASYPLPLTFNMGVAYDIIQVENNKLTLGAVMSHPNDGSEKFKFGGEYGRKGTLFIRAGYVYDEDIWEDVKVDVLTDEEKEAEKEPIVKKIRYGNRISFGVGVKTKVGGQELIVNYAAYDMGRLGLRNQISLDFGF